MSVIIFLAIMALIVVLFGLKWNNLRTKMAFIFIALGVFFVFLMGLLVTGNWNVTTMAEFFSETKVYFLWVKSALGKIFEVTGKIIDFDWIKNSVFLALK